MKTLLFIIANFAAINIALSQGTAINPAGSAPDSSAGLDVNFSNKGVLIPRLSTTERNAIVSPAASLLIYNTTTKCFEFFEDNYWQSVICSCPKPASPTEGTHAPAQGHIIWQWNAVSGASGYKWNTVNDYNSAVDMGTNTSKAESGLACETSFTRYVWSYNSCGGSAALAINDTTTSCYFLCGTSTVTDIENNTYNTIQIGTQCWLKENLKTGVMIASLEADNSTPKNQLDNSIIEKYCYDYEQDGNSSQQATGAANCAVYGGLYQWHEAVQYKDGATHDNSVQPSLPAAGICPGGWHIPSDAEWCTLEIYIDNTVSCYATSARGTDAGTRMKTDNVSYPGNCNGTQNCNSSGFSALAGGYRYGTYDSYAVFSGFGVYCTYWSSDIGISTHAWDRYETNDTRTTRFEDPKTMGCSIRCVKD